MLPLFGHKIYQPKLKYTVLMLNKKSQGGFSVVYVAAVVLIGVVIIGTYVRLTHSDSYSQQSDYNAAASQNMKNIKIGEGVQSVRVDGKTVLKLPSGAAIDLHYFKFDPDTYGSGDTEINRFEHSPTFKAYHKGYLYSLSNYNCQSGQVAHDDYSSNERLLCNFTLSTERSAPPRAASYNGVSFTASSQSRQIYDHSLKSVRTSEPGQSAYYDLEAPYMQFWGKGDGTYWGASGNTLRIKTVYGVGAVTFGEQSFGVDVQNKAVKSVQIGPLTAHVRMTGVGCYPPYLDSAGLCHPSVMTSGPYKGETVYTYNRVDYAFNFTQTSKQPTSERLVVHY